MELVREEIIGTINQLVSHMDVIEYFKESDSISDIGLDSIKFIKMIVILEGIFDIEFEDDTLVIDHFNTLQKLEEYITGKLEDKK